MDILLFKALAFVFIFLVGIAGGLCSRWLSGAKHSELLFSLGNAFAGGVFLGAGLLHMLPDAQEGFKNLIPESDYPWFALVCCGGFLLFLEKVLMHHEHSQQVEPTPKETATLSPYPYVLLVVLSVHSIITGIALGTEGRISQASVILLAVLAHKGTASFSLGISLFRANVPCGRIYRMIALFALMTPLGILLGVGCMHLMDGWMERAFEAGFDALAAGTFLYVALLDIVDDEFSRRHHLALKFGLVILGLAVMAVVAIWT
jgi:zinc transporter 1/2/3